ncbi:MAG: hypothetical protein IKM71_05875 [Bacteroidaceae bacterium]|nr:hypothetical protein [Bacteroidaceae bacterium]MBR6819977.1 hypothetical protein [Bacteroidaceae bacterium]MBR7051805.1 hypothetical protein [Bacteroidaceae bacterium]
MIHHPLIWLRRFRHRKGYGVHSPYAYNFLRDVIYESNHYYAYDEIEKKVKGNWWQRMVMRKRERLLFRLKNWCGERPFIHAMSWSGEVARQLTPDAMLVLDHLQDNLVAWQRIKKDARTRVTFDLYDLGIALFNPELTKQNYIVNW